MSMHYDINTIGGISCYYVCSPNDPEIVHLHKDKTKIFSIKEVGTPYLADAAVSNLFIIKETLSTSVHKLCARTGFISALSGVAHASIKLIMHGHSIIGSSILLGSSILTYLFEKSHYGISESYRGLKSPTKQIATVSTVLSTAIPLAISASVGAPLVPVIGVGLVIHAAAMTALKRYNHYIYGYWNFSRLRAEAYEYEINLWRRANLEYLRDLHPQNPQLVKKLFASTAFLREPEFSKDRVIESLQ